MPKSLPTTSPICLFAATALALCTAACHGAPSFSLNPSDTLRIHTAFADPTVEAIDIDIDATGCYRMQGHNARIDGCLPKEAFARWLQHFAATQPLFGPPEPNLAPATKPSLPFWSTLTWRDANGKSWRHLARNQSEDDLVTDLIRTVENFNQPPLPGPPQRGGWQTLQLRLLDAHGERRLDVSTRGRWRCAIDDRRLTPAYQATHGVLAQADMDTLFAPLEAYSPLAPLHPHSAYSAAQPILLHVTRDQEEGFIEDSAIILALVAAWHRTAPAASPLCHFGPLPVAETPPADAATLSPGPPLEPEKRPPTRGAGAAHLGSPGPCTCRRK